MWKTLISLTQSFLLNFRHLHCLLECPISWNDKHPQFKMLKLPNPDLFPQTPPLKKTTACLLGLHYPSEQRPHIETLTPRSYSPKQPSANSIACTFKLIAVYDSIWTPSHTTVFFTDYNSHLPGSPAFSLLPSLHLVFN